MRVADYRGLDEADRAHALLTVFAVSRARIGLTPREYQDEFGCSRMTFYRDIERLERWGCNFETDQAPAGRRQSESEVRYRLAPGHPVAGWMVQLAHPPRVRRTIWRDPLALVLNLPLFEGPAQKKTPPRDGFRHAPGARSDQVSHHAAA